MWHPCPPAPWPHPIPPPQGGLAANIFDRRPAAPWPHPFLAAQGVLAANIFDWGAKACVDLYQNATILGEAA